jgi:hypothetical protein
MLMNLVLLPKYYKNADRISLTELQYHKVLSSRVHNFIKFLMKLQTVSRMTPELETVFVNLDELGTPETAAADTALLAFLRIKVDSYLSNALDHLFSGDTDCTGMHAFLHLREICAPQDHISQHEARLKFNSLVIGTVEQIQSFNLRFNTQHRLVRTSGIKLTDNEVVDTYLRAVHLA